MSETQWRLWNSGAVQGETRRDADRHGNWEMHKWHFHDQVFGVAMEAGFVHQVRLHIRRHMRIGVVCHQGMDRNLWRDGQCKKGQQPAREDGSYNAMMPQAAI